MRLLGSLLGFLVERFGLLADELVSRFTVDRLAVLAHERFLCSKHPVDDFGVGGSHAALRRQYLCVLDDAGLAFFIQKRDERFARAKLENLVLCVERRVLAEGLRGGLNGLLLGRGVGAQSVLDAVRELREHLVGDIRR